MAYSSVFLLLPEPEFHLFTKFPNAHINILHIFNYLPKYFLVFFDQMSNSEVECLKSNAVPPESSHAELRTNVALTVTRRHVSKVIRVRPLGTEYLNCALRGAKHCNSQLSQMNDNQRKINMAKSSVLALKRRLVFFLSFFFSVSCHNMRQVQAWLLSQSFNQR